MLGPVAPTEERLREIVATLLGSAAAPVDPADVTIEWATATDCGRAGSSPTTAGLHRVRGVARIGAGDPVGWKAFVKTLRHPRLWPQFDALPEEVAALLADRLPWRAEIDVSREAAAASFRNVPFAGQTVGLRPPRIGFVDDAVADHAAIWMEDVDVDPNWTDARFLRAAFALGLVSARRAGRAGPVRTRPDYAGVLAASRQVRTCALSMLSLDSPWVAPLIDELPDVVSLRADLTVLCARLEDLATVAAHLPHLPAHGNAAPAKLLVPRTEPGTFVAVDWAPATPMPVGFDLGLLLFGQVFTGELAAARLPILLPQAEAVHVAGLAAGRVEASIEDVHQGFVASAALRSVVSLVPVELMDTPVDPSGAALFRERVTACRWLVDLATEVLPPV